MPQTQTSKVFFATSCHLPAPPPLPPSSSFPVDQKFHSNSIGSASILRTVQRVTATEAAREGRGGGRSENFCAKCARNVAERRGRGNDAACGCYVALSESLSFVISWLRKFLALRLPQNKKCNLVTRKPRLQFSIPNRPV